MKNIYRITAFIVVVFAVGFLFTTATVAGRLNTTDAEVMAIETAIVKEGATGDTVSLIQTKLKNWGYYTGNVDGIFGPLTKNAVIYFQQKNGLLVDGIVGDQTFAALGIYNSSTDSSSSLSSSDTYLLAKLVYAEARGESYTGQVAVCAVVLNRIKSSSFPNTVSGVIYEKNAFTCVSDGQINLTPDDTAKKAVQDALNGWDPSGGALFYYNPAVATSSWIFSRPTTVVIGMHVFAT